MQHTTIKLLAFDNTVCKSIPTKHQTILSYLLIYTIVITNDVWLEQLFVPLAVSRLLGIANSHQVIQPRKTAC